MLIAKEKDYRRAFLLHYNTFTKWDPKDKKNGSRILVLIYCVECGLKYKLMNEKKSKMELNTHDFRKLLRGLGEDGRSTFQSFKTKHGDIVDSNTYHQMFRYKIEWQKEYDKKNRNL